jgi:3-methyladenine DNA glycosylase AlkC
MTIPESILKRKGSTTTAGVPAEVRKLLDAGLLQTVNLSEWLVVDQIALSKVVFTEFGWPLDLAPSVDALKTRTTPKVIEAAALLLSAYFTTKTSLQAALAQLQQHESDLVRGWGCYLLGQTPLLSLEERIQAVRPFAADLNMSVRETAWLGIRHRLAEDIVAAIGFLEPLVHESDPNLRRFASEATRPRGVWCSHLTLLKAEPQHALPLLEPLKADLSKYVRDSVGNWLNDASKSQPEWVRALCKRWESPASAYIIKRALRTLVKDVAQ